MRNPSAVHRYGCSVTYGIGIICKCERVQPDAIVSMWSTVNSRPYSKPYEILGKCRCRVQGLKRQSSLADVVFSASKNPEDWSRCPSTFCMIALGDSRGGILGCHLRQLQGRAHYREGWKTFLQNEMQHGQLRISAAGYIHADALHRRPA